MSATTRSTTASRPKGRRPTRGPGLLSPLRLAAGIVLLLLAAAVVSAVGPRVWRQSGYEDLRQGRARSVSLTTSGEVLLAPEIEELWESESPHVWSVAAATDGTIYLAAGNEGEVLRRTPDAEEPEVFFAAPQLEVQAIVTGPDDHLYVATSPRGGVFRVPPDHDRADLEPFFFPRQTYAWSLAFDARGHLYVGTGGEGIVFEVDAEGEGEPLYDSQETHITALGVDVDGDVIAGTASNGHLYRISPEGEVFVLFDAPYREITDLVATDDGIYFTTLGTDDGRASSGDEAPPTPSGRSVTQAGSEEGPGGAVYLARPDGFVERLWVSESQGVHSVAVADRGVVVGTGPRGTLVRIGPDGESTLLAEVDASQVTAVEASPRGLVFATSNLGKAFRMQDGFRDSGEYLSRVKDAETTSTWGTIRWRADAPAETGVRLWTRSGNTGEPDDTWSSWSGPYTDPDGSRVDSPDARYVQWKAELSSENPAASPSLHGVELVYVQRNLRPEVDELVVHPPGVVYRRSSSFEDSMPFTQLPDPIREALAEQNGDRAGTPSSGSRSFLGRPFYVSGLRTFSWRVEDPNGDELAHRVEYRGSGESTWKPLVRELGESLYVWDTTTVPDGRYQVRLVAGDGPSNPEEQALEAVRVSEPFVIDHSPPRVGELATTVEGNVVGISGEVVDDVSLVRRIDYSVDGGDWQVVRTADGLADSTSEGIRFTVGGLDAGEHTIVVRVTDTALNSGSARAVVTIR